MVVRTGIVEAQFFDFYGQWPSPSDGTVNNNSTEYVINLKPPARNMQKRVQFVAAILYQAGDGQWPPSSSSLCNLRSLAPLLLFCKRLLKSVFGNTRKDKQTKWLSASCYEAKQGLVYMCRCRAALSKPWSWPNEIAALLVGATRITSMSDSESSIAVYWPRCVITIPAKLCTSI